MKIFTLNFTSLALRRHLKRLALQLAVICYVSARFRFTTKHTLPEVCFPSAYTVEAALFFVSCETSKRLYLVFQKSHPQGLATLTMVSAVPNLGDTTPQHSWDFLFRVLLLFGDPKKVSLFCFRSCAYFQDPSGFEPALQRFTPTKKAVPLFATSIFFRGGVDCSPEISYLLGFQSAQAHQENVSFSRFPFRF